MKPSNELSIEVERIKMNDLMDELMEFMNDALNVCYDIKELIEKRNSADPFRSKTWGAVNEVLNELNFLIDQSIPSLNEQIKVPGPNPQLYS